MSVGARRTAAEVGRATDLEAPKGKLHDLHIETGGRR